MTDDDVRDIVKMSSVNHDDMKQVDLAKAYPHYDKFIFLTYGALCTANHLSEGLFSLESTLLRKNMSDECLDRKVRYTRNIMHPILKQVLHEAKSRVISKGCKGDDVTAIGTRDDCQKVVSRIRDILSSK